jgi:hypothetical protein
MSTKTCSRCLTEKCLSEFGKNSQAKDGKYAYCKPCNSEKTKTYYHNLPPEKRDEYNHRNNLKRKFGLTVEQYQAMLSAQGGVCAICFLGDVEGKRLAVDHCHQTNNIRGLLCSHCNTGLGKFRDNTTLLASAITYLTSSTSLL